MAGSVNTAGLGGVYVECARFDADYPTLYFRKCDFTYTLCE